MNTRESRNMTFMERFESKWTPEPYSGCWLWTSVINPRGYPTFSVKGLPKVAHQLSYRLHVGPITEGLCVLHRCDTKSCVNPAHLRLGTSGENTREAVARGHWPKRDGSNNGNARLTEDQVREIRTSKETYTALAKKFRVGLTQIGKIKTGQAWKNLK